MARWPDLLFLVLVSMGPFGVAATAQLVQPPRIAAGTAAISGRVTDVRTGEPLAEVHVTLHDVQTHHQLVDLTGPDGQFRFEGLAAGLYGVTPRRSGYLEVVRQDSMDHHLHAFTTVIQVADGRRRTLDVVMAAAATIRGRVMDGLGAPVEGATVMVATRETFASSPTRAILGRRAASDAHGMYEIGELAPGELVVAADAESARNPAREAEASFESIRTYFPGVATLEDASTIHLIAGHLAGGVDIPLIQVPLHTLRVHVASAGTSLTPVDVTLLSSPARSVHRAAVTEGATSFGPLRPGRYVVWARTELSDGIVAAWQAVDLSTDVAQALDVALPLAPGGRLSGRVVTADGTPVVADGVRIVAALADGGVDVDPVPRDDVKLGFDGTFAFDGVFGERLFRVIGLPPDWEVLQVYAGRTPVTTVAIESAAHVRDVTVVVGTR